MKAKERHVPLKKLPAVGRRVHRLLPEGLIKTGGLEAEAKLPLVIEPSGAAAGLIAFAAGNRALIAAKLREHGAILFRNFGVGGLAGFEQFIKASTGELLPYLERTSPRTHLGGGVYSSTDYPAEQSIFLHNEHSYASTFPLKIFFFCVQPSPQGGETPLCDTRGVLRRIRQEVREEFERRRYTYVRNFHDSMGLSWQTAFQTRARLDVEDYCHGADINFKWRRDGGLKTWQVRPALIEHPQTGEAAWFNHAAFFHITTLPSSIREALLKEFGEEGLPNNTFYGDGSAIEAPVLDEIREAYRQETVVFPWRQGDILMLDNILTAHGRMPFRGERKVAVGMSEPFTRN